MKKSLLPLNGRSFNTLLQLTPGVVIASNPRGVGAGQFSIAGQRTESNNFIVDGVSANFGINPSLNVGASGAGESQALSALGGTSSLVSVEALEEFRVETSSYAPEFGRYPGGQIFLNTRSGKNQFHGGVYEYLRNDAMDARDWFNRTPQSKAPERHNDFGGFLGGPIWRNRTFFFFSYEGARLRLPSTLVFQVPSTQLRAAAPAALAPFLNAYPVPNGPVAPSGNTAQLTGSFSNAATLNATSIRVDHKLNDKWSVFGRYNYAPSQTRNRVGGLNEIDTTKVDTQTVTGGLNVSLTPAVFNAIHVNYSKQDAGLTSSVDSFGGAVVPPANTFFGTLDPAKTRGAFLAIGAGGIYAFGPVSNNVSKQLNFVDSLTVAISRHQLKFGVDYRTGFTDQVPNQNLALYLVSSVSTFVTTGRAILQTSAFLPTYLLTQAFSAYGQDTWRVSDRLNLTYGVRWELSPAPSARRGTRLASWQNTNDPSRLALAPLGTQLWNTRHLSLAPRIGLAYALTTKRNTVLRVGGGIFYDLGVSGTANLAVFFPNTASRTVSAVVPVPDITPLLPAISLNPPYTNVRGFANDLTLPRSYQWNVALERSFGDRQAVSITYVGQAGRKLLRQEALLAPNPGFTTPFVLTGNGAYSNYNSLQFQYRRPVWHGVQLLANYSWSHSLDNASDDVVAGLASTIVSAARDYASSDFDVRHSVSAGLIYRIPPVKRGTILAPISEGWSVAGIIVVRTGFPFNVQTTSASPVSIFAATRADRVAGQPTWLSDPVAPRGQKLNPDAFVAPSSLRQGSEARNDIPGFGFSQVDLSLGRIFAVADKLQLQFRADAFNVLNHPNFANPVANLNSGPSTFSSTFMLNRGLGGLNPLFQEGGPRSLQLSLKLTF